MHNIRYRNIYSEYREQFESLGVKFKHEATVTFPIIYSALESYKAAHNNSLLVPHKFKVPTGDARYPENTWELKLGAIVRQIAFQNAWSKHREQFEALGLEYKDSVTTPVVEID